MNAYAFRSAFFLLILFLTTYMPVNAAPVSESGNLPAVKTSVASHRTSLPLSGIAKEKSTIESTADHKAQVFEVEGNVRVLKAGAEQWQPAEKGMVLEKGDKLVTSKGAQVDIVYDSNFLNIARIQENTKAEFRDIEPTDLYLEDGKIFNALDGLNGSEYQIATPTAVAAVRGTTFEMGYEAAGKDVSINVFPDHSEHLGEVMMSQGDLEISLTEGDGFARGVIGEIPQESIDKANAFMNEIETSFTGERQAGLEKTEVKTENSEEKPVQEKKDENKVAQGPNDGGDHGRGGNTGSSLKQETILPQDKAEGTKETAAAQVQVDRFIDKALDVLPDQRINPEIQKPEFAAPVLNTPESLKANLAENKKEIFIETSRKQIEAQRTGIVEDINKIKNPDPTTTTSTIKVDLNGGGGGGGTDGGGTDGGGGGDSGGGGGDLNFHDDKI